MHAARYLFEYLMTMQFIDMYIFISKSKYKCKQFSNLTFVPFKLVNIVIGIIYAICLSDEVVPGIRSCYIITMMYILNLILTVPFILLRDKVQ